MIAPPRKRAAGAPRRHNGPYRPAGRGHAVAPFVLSATLYLIVAAALALALSAGLPLPGGPGAWRWPVVHLAFVGGATQLIVGAMAFFAATLLLTDAPPRWLTRAQWALVNAGALALAGSALLGWPWLGAAGGVAVLAALALLLAALRLLQRRSLAAPDVTLRYYRTAIAFLMAGALLGILMLLGLSDALLPRARVRLAHMHLNLLGWITLSIVGTMRLFFGTTLGRPAGRLNPPWAEYWPLTLGTVAQALGWLTGAMAIVGVGSLVQLAGVLAHGGAIVRQWRAHREPLPLAAGHLLAATFWLLGMMFGALLAGVIRADGFQAADWTAMVALAGFVGFIGQTILGAWTHLFPVVVSLPSAPPPMREAPLQPRLRAIFAGQRKAQLALANLGAAGIVLGAGLAPPAPALASALSTVGAVALAIVLALVACKAGRGLGLARMPLRGGAIRHVAHQHHAGGEVPRLDEAQVDP